MLVVQTQEGRLLFGKKKQDAHLLESLKEILNKHPNSEITEYEVITISGPLALVPRIDIRYRIDDSQQDRFLHSSDSDRWWANRTFAG